MSGSVRTVGFRISAEGAVQARREIENFGKSGEAALRRVQDVTGPTAAAIRGLSGAAIDLGRGLNGLEGMTRSLGQLGGMAGLIAVGIGTAAAAVVGLGAAIAKAGDQATMFTAKFTQATGSIEGARIAYQELFAVTQRTGVSIASTADTFVRFRTAAGQIGATSAQAVKLTENLQKTAAVSGIIGEQGAMAMMQLAQALSSGNLAGDELRSLMENMPALAGELASQLGVSYGQMRKLGEEGKLTADKVFPALMKATEKMASDFDRFPPTMERGFGILGAAMLNFGMNLDRALGLSQKIAAAAIAAANAVNSVQRWVAPDPFQAAQNDVERTRQNLANLRNAPRVGPDPNDPNLAPIQRAQLAGTERARQDAIRQAEADFRAANERMEELQREAGRAQFGEYVRTGEKARENAKAQQAIAVREVLESNNKRLKIEREYREELDKINKAEAAGVTEIPGHTGKFDPVAARAAALKNYNEELEKLDKDGKKAADAAEKLAEKTAKVTGALAVELDKQQRLSEARIQGEAAVKELNVQLEIEKQIRDAGLPSAERRTKAQQEEAEAIAYTVTQIERYKAAAQAAEDAQKRVADAQKKAEADLKQTTDDVVKYSADRFADMFGRNGRGFKGLMDSFYDLAVKTFARIAAEAIIRPVIAPIISPLIQGISGLITGGGGATGVGGVSDLLGLGSLFGGKGLLEAIGLTGSGGLLGSTAITGWATSTNTALAGMGGAFGPATESAVMAAGGGGLFGGAGATFGQLFGGVGAGFAAGSLLNNLLGRKGPQATNGMIGSGLGSLAGAAIGSFVPVIGPLLGGLLGGALGGGFGGLFGPGESVKGYGLRLQSSGFTGTENGFADTLNPIDYKYYNETGKAVFAEAEQTVAAVNAFLKAQSMQVAGVSIIGGNKNGADYSWADAGSVAEGFTRLRFRSKDDQQLTDALANRQFGGAAEFIQWVQGFNQFRDQMKALVDGPTPEFTQQMDALKATFDAAIAKAREYGLAETSLNVAREREIEKLNQQRAETLRRSGVALDVRILRAQGQDGAADLMEQAENARQELDAFSEALDKLAITAEEKAAQLVHLERAQAEERAQIIRDQNEAIRNELLRTGGSIRDYLDKLQAGPGSSASPTDRLTAAQSQFGRDLALARGGDEDALNRITGTADSLLAAASDMYASGSDYQALRQFVISSLENLPSVQSYDQQILQALRDLGGSIDVKVGVEFVRVITEAINALPDAERQRLIQTSTVLRTVEERLGRLLTSDEVVRLATGGVVLQTVEQALGRALSAAERAELLAGGAILQTVEQALGRALSAAERAELTAGGVILQTVEQALGRSLTADERAGLVQAATVVRSVEQTLGRSLTPAEQAQIIQSAVVYRGINQTIFAPTGTIVVPENEAVLRGIFQQVLEATGATLLTADTVTRLVRQAVETTETVQISRSIDDKLSGLLTTANGILATMRDFMESVKNNTGNMANTLASWRQGAEGGDTLGGGGWSGAFASGAAFYGGNVVPFAKGGIPDFVSQPSIAPMALFGEAGPEAIMPLRRGSDGRLGVQAVSPRVDLAPLVSAIARLEQALRLSTEIQAQETRDAATRVVDELVELSGPLRRAVS